MKLQVPKENKRKVLIFFENSESSPCKLNLPLLLTINQINIKTKLSTKAVRQAHNEIFHQPFPEILSSLPRATVCFDISGRNVYVCCWNHPLSTLSVEAVARRQWIRNRADTEVKKNLHNIFMIRVISGMVGAGSNFEHNSPSSFNAIPCGGCVREIFTVIFSCYQKHPSHTLSLQSVLFSEHWSTKREREKRFQTRAYRTEHNF